MTDFAHHCSACGEMHGGPGGETEAVKIAKINADRDIEVARLARSEARQEIEAGVETAEIEAVAEVESAVVAAEVLEEIVAPPDPDPAPAPETPDIVEVPVDSEPVDEGPGTPAELDRKEPASHDKGFWAGYATR